MPFYKILFLALLCATSLTAQTELEKFEQYKLQQQTDFQNYHDEINQAYRNYKDELNRLWKHPELSSKKKWLSYSKDKKTKTKVGFESKQITIQTIASSEKEAQNRLKKALAIVITDDTQSANQRDVLQQKIETISKKNSQVVSKKIKPQAILTPIIFKKPPTSKDIINYVNTTVKPKTISISKAKNSKTEKVYTLTVALPKDLPIKRSKIYLKNVQKNADRFKLPISLVFAIIETESAFNPRATSYVPAYGLMQIVPRTAGIDSYLFVYKKRKMPSAEYLYDGERNIEMGSAYLHILYYRYLKKIRDPQSRLYCTMAAYNTGAGNVAWAFTKKMNISKAAKKINSMKAKEVYNHLKAKLKYKEARNYLEKVNTRMLIYNKIFKL
jgi:membrane-bound lytic murein transglycosylase C